MCTVHVNWLENPLIDLTYLILPQVNIIVGNPMVETPKPKPNYFSGEILTQCGASGVEDVNKAIDSAKSAFPAWSKMSGLQRGHILRKAGDLIKVGM